MDAEKLPKVVVLAIESALAIGRQLSWKVQENSFGNPASPGTMARATGERQITHSVLWFSISAI